MVEKIKSKTDKYRKRLNEKVSVASFSDFEIIPQELVATVDRVVKETKLAKSYIAPGQELADSDAVLAGAGHILAEDFAEQAEGRALVRRKTWQEGIFCSTVARGKESQVSKYEMYYDFREALKDVPSHRMLAMRRGEKEEMLRLRIEAPEEEILAGLISLLLPSASPYRQWLTEVVRDSYQPGESVDGYLAGLPQERLLPALHAVNVYPFEQPMQDLGLG